MILDDKAGTHISGISFPLQARLSKSAIKLSNENIIDFEMFREILLLLQDHGVQQPRFVEAKQLRLVSISL